MEKATGGDVMIIVIDWNTFQLRYLLKNNIYCLEDEKNWNFYTYEETACLKCVVKKSDNLEQNMMFVTRHLADRPNVIKVLAIEDLPKPELEEESEMLSKQPEVEVENGDRENP